MGFARSDETLADGAGDGLGDALDPDVEWTEMAGFPLAGTYRTPEGVTSNVMERLAADWDDWAAHDGASPGGAGPACRIRLERAS